MTSVFPVRMRPSMTPLSFSGRQMVREASLTEVDLVEVEKCRRDHNRLGFAYQIGFVRLSWLNANYQRALFHYVRKCSADRLREVARPRRLAALVCFLRLSYRDAVSIMRWT